MPRVRPIVLGHMEFATWTAVRAYLKPQVEQGRRHPERSWDSLVLSDLVQKHHYRIKHWNEAPTAFRMQRCERTAERPFDTELAGYFPSRGWVVFSYRKCCTDTPLTFEREYALAGRRRFGARYREKVRAVQCHRCGAYGHHEVDHVRPTFEAIIAATLPLAGEAVRDGWLNHAAGEDWELPEGEACTVEFDRLHQDAEYQTLCSACHKGITARRTDTDDAGTPCDTIEF